MTKKEKETILAFAENDMKVNRTAEELKLHGNSVKYRLTQIAVKYKYNPFVFYDLIELVKKAGGSIG